MIEVGRQKSINAVNESAASYDSMVWIVCQNDIMVDNPAEKDLYRFGTLSKIKVVRKKEGFMPATCTLRGYEKQIRWYHVQDVL